MITIAPAEAQTLPAILARRAADRPDQIALVGNDGTGVYRAVSYGELHAVASGLASLIAESVDAERPAPRVAWIYGNSAPLHAIALYHAVAMLGAVAVPVNPASTPDELSDILDRADASLLFAPRGLELAAATRGRRIIHADSFEEFAQAVADREPVTRDVSPGSPAIILFTSGTTGRSKGVVHTQRSALAAGRGWGQAFELGPDDVYQSPFPVYAGAGLHFSAIACLIAGCTYVIDEARPTQASLKRVEQYGATVYGAVPSIYQYWLGHDLDEYDLSSLRLLDFGGAVMHKATIAALRGALPGVQLIQTYGLTEAGPGGLYLPPAHLDDKFGSIGCIGSGGLRFRVVAQPDSEAPADGETIGELQFAGESLMKEYLDDPESTGAVFDGEWMRTGDLVRLDRDGFVFFLDRMKDLIIRGGYNISSIEVEEAITAYPAVREAAVFGVPHERLGEVVGVAIVPEREEMLDIALLRSFLSHRLARVKVPERIIVLDALPVSAAGKVLKSALKVATGLAEWR